LIQFLLLWSFWKIYCQVFNRNDKAVWAWSSLKKMIKLFDVDQVFTWWKMRGCWGRWRPQEVGPTASKCWNKQNKNRLERCWTDRQTNKEIMKMLDKQTNKKQRVYEDARQTNKQKLSNKILLISKRLG